MSNYHFLERRLARILKKFPGFQRIKSLYQGVNYLLFGKQSVPSVVDTAVLQAEIDEPRDFFFGYYDKSPWSRDGNSVLYHRVAENKNEVEIVRRNLSTNETCVLGTTEAWNWQQGAMTQWLPGHDRLAVFNRLSENHSLIAEIRNSDNAEWIKQLPMPIQTLRKDGQAAISLNYRRLAALRPDYGYCCEATNFSPDQPDDKDGLFYLDMESGRTELIVSLEKLKTLHDFPLLGNPRHKVNHAMYAPSGNRLAFMHRCMHSRGKKSRLYVVRDDGTGLKLIHDEGGVSHYSWRNESSLICFCQTLADGYGYYTIDVDTGQKTPLAKSLWPYGDGHPSQSPCGGYMITDTYPDRSRMQHLFLYDLAKDQVKELGCFFSALRFRAEKRCDLHPRWSPDGQFVSLDTTDTGKRKMRILDISNIF